MTNPVDEYLDSAHGSVKTAGFFSEMGRGAKEVLAPGRLGGHMAGAALIGATGYVLPRAADKIYRAITKARDYRVMMEANPDLHDFHTADPAMFNRHFTSLRNMAPEFTADPVIAGTYMRRLSQNPQTAGTVILEAAGMATGHGTVTLDAKTRHADSSDVGMKFQPAGGIGRRR
jgi:hypothetical protein